MIRIPELFSLFPLFHNPLFKIGNRTINPERINIPNKPDFQIADLMHPETNTLFTHDGFRQHYNSDITLRSYNAITNSIERALALINTHWGQVEAHCAPRESILIAIACKAKKGCSPYYRLWFPVKNHTYNFLYFKKGEIS